MHTEDIEFVDYGGFWVRFVAYLIDSFVLFIIQGISNLVFFGSLSMELESMSGEEKVLYFTVNILLGVAYFAGMESSKNMATLGKMALDLRVVDENGNQLSFLRATGRYFAKILSGLLLLIGYIMAAFDSRKQALHDKLAKTLVIVTNK